MTSPWSQMHFNSGGVAKFHKSLWSRLPVFITNMHIDVVRLRKTTGFSCLVKYVRPRRVKPHSSYALRGGTNHRGKQKHSARERLQPELGM